MALVVISVQILIMLYTHLYKLTSVIMNILNNYSFFFLLDKNYIKCDVNMNFNLLSM